eukprot:3361114-Pleurochrysis_carterae.AAC.3
MHNPSGRCACARCSVSTPCMHPYYVCTPGLAAALARAAWCLTLLCMHPGGACPTQAAAVLARAAW